METTVVTWGRDRTPDEITKLNAKSDMFVAMGLTDGKPSSDGIDVRRSWTTRETAQMWIDYVNTFTPAPTASLIL